MSRYSSLRERHEALVREVATLRVQVAQLAEIVGYRSINVPEQAPTTKWVRADSDEWRAEEARLKKLTEEAERFLRSYPPRPYF